MKLFFLCIFAMLAMATHAADVNITTHGAVGDGRTLNTAAIQKAIDACQCKQVDIENVKIISHGVAHNDGIDIDGCQEVRIKNCDIESGDDVLCFKTSSSKMACKNIVVTGMRLKSGHGAIKMGTESMAPFENIRISETCARLLFVKTGRG